jgi:hypothetical protein
VKKKKEWHAEVLDLLFATTTIYFYTFLSNISYNEAISIQIVIPTLVL